MTRYYSFSLVLSVVMLCLWLASWVLYDPPGLGDGNGPDLLGILLFFSIWLMALLLLNSALLAWYLRSRLPASILAGKHGIGIHVALIGIYGAFLTALLR
ncbi:hypothetical protein [Stenotrophomonas rhizophila]|uniref:hypothetical protein n=1 Tax=Stenotrophomonas rhizophila TaxID=216778 RepID=UPI0028ADBAEF|nr:hypothetical protein [Stenotrophomonas rhizophila]